MKNRLLKRCIYCVSELEYRKEIVNKIKKMNIVELPFAKVTKLEDSLAEIVVDEGVELSSEMVAQFHEVLLTNFSQPIGILVNKINEYAYTFRAQLRLGDTPEIRAIGVVAYSEMSIRTTNSLKNLPRKSPLNLEIFDSRKRALDWLKSQLLEKRTTTSGAS